MLLSSVYQNNLITLAVDEAHCVKSWGDQFRKSLARIGDLRSLLPKDANVLALTATASEETLKVVIEWLSMLNVTIVAMPPSCDNIYHEINTASNIRILLMKLWQSFCESVCSSLKLLCMQDLTKIV